MRFVRPATILSPLFLGCLILTGCWSSSEGGDFPETPQPPPSSNAGLLSAAAVVLAVTVGLVLFARQIVQPGRLGFGPENHAAVGKPLPISGLVPLAGGAEPLLAGDLEGRVVLVNFWATWCGPCRMELPHLARLHQRLADSRNVAIVAISVDETSIGPLRAEAKKLLKALDVRLPLYANPTGEVYQAFHDAGGGRSIPTSVLLDRRGVIRAVWVGFPPNMEEVVGAAIRRLVDEPTPP